MATVDEIQLNAQLLANTLIQTVADGLGELNQKARDVSTFLPTVADANLALINTSGGLSSVTTSVSTPSLTSYAGVAAPSTPTLGAVTVPASVNIESFDDTKPTLNLPTAPSNSLPAAPANAPDFNAPSLPDRPTITLPSVPSFAAILIPDAPALDLPIFSATAPIDSLVEPSTQYQFNEADYSDTLLTSMKAKLQSDLDNGGYGIDAGDENGLWERARERELRAADIAIDEATSQIAARGFVLPPGALFMAQQQAEEGVLDKTSTLNRDIALKRADMYVQARQFAIGKANEVEQMLVTFAAGRAERALNAAKAQIDVGISLYQLRVEKFKAALSSYQVQAGVYETQIRASLQKLEVFKAQIEGARAAAEVQTLQVQVYRSQVDAANLIIGLYRTEMEAARIKADVERLKLEGFKAQVEAYASQVGAREAEFRMFSAQIQGETAKVEVYKASADAYRSKVDGVKTKVEADDIIAKAQIATNESILRRYLADVESYRAQISKINDENTNILRGTGLTVEIERALNAQEHERRLLVTEVSKGNASIYAQQAQLNIEAAKSRLQAYLTAQGITVDAYKFSNDALGRIASSALSQLTAVASKTE